MKRTGRGYGRVPSKVLYDRNSSRSWGASDFRGSWTNCEVDDEKDKAGSYEFYCDGCV